MSKNFVSPQITYLNKFSFRVCGCCQNPLKPYASVVVHGIRVWTFYAVILVMAGAVMLTIKAASLAVVCPEEMNTTFTNFSNIR